MDLPGVNRDVDAVGGDDAGKAFADGAGFEDRRYGVATVVMIAWTLAAS